MSYWLLLLSGHLGLCWWRPEKSEYSKPAASVTLPSRAVAAFHTKASSPCSPLIQQCVIHFSLVNSSSGCLFSFSHGSSLWKKKAQNSKNWPILLLGHLELENWYPYSCGYSSQQSTQIKPKFSKSIRFFHKTTWWTLNLLTGNLCFSSMDSLKGLKTTFLISVICFPRCHFSFVKWRSAHVAGTT